ncbi:MAG: hypothetical protein R6X25_12930 [Candidatus Krumholzibacteriia bacterium]
MSTKQPTPVRLALRVAATAALVALIAPALAGATDDLPAAEEILDRYVEATGGADAYGKLENRLVTGTFGMPAMGMTGQMTIRQAAPDRMRMTVELPGIGTIESGYTGETAWELNPMTGARLLEGEEAAMAHRQAVFNSELKWRELYESVKTLGAQAVDDRKAYAVEMTPTEGRVETRYYDAESGILIKTVQVQPTQMGEIPVETTVSDYQDFDGILIPTHATIDMSVQELVTTVDDVQHNVALPDDAFAPPAPVQALIEEQAAAAEQ